MEGFKYLSKKSLNLVEVDSFHSDHERPPSPRDCATDIKAIPLPAAFPKIDESKTLPLVREIGVKAFIVYLSEQLGLKDYKTSLLQFWFLDILTDIVWRAQDEYQFPDEHQKSILEWVFFVFDLIRCFFNIAPHLNLSRKKLFKIFEEALSVAEDYIESGCKKLPVPEELFAIDSPESEEQEESEVNLESDEEDNVSAASTSTSNSTEKKTNSYLAIKDEEMFKYFKLPAKKCEWDDDNDCLSSSVGTASEDEVSLIVVPSGSDVAHEQPSEDEEDLDFYKPDMRVPSRFLDNSDVESSHVSFDSISNEESIHSQPPEWMAKPRKEPKDPCPSLIIHTQESVEEEEADNIKKKEEDIVQAWFDYHIWQQRIENMADPKKGAIFETTPSNVVNGQPEDDSEEEKGRLSNILYYLDIEDDAVREMKQNMFVNTCALMAIKQFVYDYFYSNFQFALIKTACSYTHYLITQQMAENWDIPKRFNGDFKRPAPKKPKKRKPEKKKKDKKKDKSSKKSKKDKKSGKSSKSTKSKSKKEKGKKEKKPKGPTREEKAEMLRMQREQARLEEERRLAEENRRFMFPLTDAATDEFFENIFENWVKPKKKEKGKGKGKGKDKSSKKSSKSSKKGKK
nr:unnamed protein product [Callosobruchus chinensis]